MESNLKPIMTDRDSFTISEVVNIIKKKKEYETTDKPCIGAKGGEVYLFSAEDKAVKKNDWRCDQYRWHNNGVTKLPNNPIIKKHYFWP